MALFKCKMCGGDLEIAQGALVAECEYCGTKQTVPKCSDENIQNVFNRATALRLKNEFDKAEKLYESIIQNDPSQAEAYWGLLLCRYGIEYVDDPKTLKKVPTCHRASYESILEDGDYKLALNNADISQRSVYAEQAVEIDRIQKGILALAKMEESYDVFICYKETDENGRRTVDSAIANDIYHQLTQYGYKVFYSAITLEGRLGQEYEPIIFSALTSAKVMLVIGTKPEYFNAVWVKNEWSRYLKLAKKDRSRLLIPCYRDMDAYGLPNEFAHLQAQDMSRIGFINDIVRGIKKVTSREERQTEAAGAQSIPAVDPRTSIVAHLKRAFIFIEDGDWSSANKHCEEVLNIDPECAEAYAIKLMIERRVKSLPELASCKTPLTASGNYIKALRFGSEQYKEMLESYNSAIVKRLIAESNENTYRNGIVALSKLQYALALSFFSKVPEYKDSAKRIAECEAAIRDTREKNELKIQIDRKTTTFSRNLAWGAAAVTLILLVICYAVQLVAHIFDDLSLEHIPVAILSSALMLLLFVVLPSALPYIFAFISMTLRSTSKKTRIALGVIASVWAAANAAGAIFVTFIGITMPDTAFALPSFIFSVIINAVVPLYIIAFAILTAVYEKNLKNKS